jgi:hypothetical protein
MKQEELNLPFSLAALIFGALSIPLAFARHLVSLAIVLAVLALILGYWGKHLNERHLLRYTAKSAKRAAFGFKLGAIGSVCAVLMWVLWASNALLH